MSNAYIVTVANHHPLHSATFRRHFQEAHDKNVLRHGPSPSHTPEPTPSLALPAIHHARPVVVYK